MKRAVPARLVAPSGLELGRLGPLTCLVRAMAANKRARGDSLSLTPFNLRREGKEKMKKAGVVGGGSSSSNGEEGEEKAKGLDGTRLNLPVNRHGNLKSASTDQNLIDHLHNIKSSKTPAVINYGASWCRVCSQILPSFCQLSNEFPKLSFVYADIDECPETTQSIRYTPTFHFFRDGEKVDEMFGAGEERLRDRLWLHS